MFKDLGKIGLAIVKEGSKAVAFGAGTAVLTTTVAVVGSAISNGDKINLDLVKSIDFDLDDLIQEELIMNNVVKTLKIYKNALTLVGGIALTAVVIKDSKK